jgi:putative ABC transport system permease protein
LNSPEPPRLAAWLVNTVTRRSPFGETIAGDLRERFDERASRAAGARAGADRWYWRQALSIAIHFTPTLFRRRAQTRGVPASQAWTDAAITVLIADLRHAVRTLTRRPVLTSVMLLTLTLGIGANAAIFSVVRAVVLKGLPYPDAGRVVALSSIRDGIHGGVSRQDAADWIAQTRAFDALGTYTVLEANASLAGEPQRIKIALATSSVFRALGVAPALGRVLLPSEDDVANTAAIVVSHRYWMSALGGDPAAVGKSVRVDGTPATVVGVMPESFAFPDAATDAWRPFGATANQTGPRGARWVDAVAHLRRGVSLEQASREMATISARLAASYPATNAGVGTLVEPQLAADTNGVRSLLFVAWAMAGLVLMIVIANTANLSLARAGERSAETSMRAALGASRWAIARLFLSESIVLSLAGGALAVLLAGVAMPMLRHLGASVGIPRVDVLSLDPWVIAYAAFVSAIAGIAFGVVPALDATRGTTMTTIRDSGRAALRRGHRAQAGLIVAQVALAAAVVVSAGLLLRSAEHLGRVEPGFAIADRVTVRIAPDWTQFPTRDDARVLFDNLLTRVVATPGIDGAAAINRLPLTGAWWTTAYEPEGQRAPPGHEPSANYRVVTANYFKVMQIPIVKGRAIDAGDRASTQLVTVVSRTLAERAWPGRDPIGQRISFAPERADAPRYTVVGVAGDVHTRGLADPLNALAYVSFGQAHFGHFNDWGMDVVLQSSVAPNAAIEIVRRELRGLAPTLPLFSGRPLSDLVARDLATRRLLLVTLGAFALTAVLLAAIGLYGVVAYGVAQRRPELGLRIALGAQSAGVAWSIVRRGLALTSAGLVAGLLMAAALARLLSGFLYGVRPIDPVTFGAAALGLLLVAVVASAVPAWRAMRVDPMTALRST